MKKSTPIIITAILFYISLSSFAQDRHFAWTYESTTLPKGSVDIEPWFTLTSGRTHFYQSYASRLEFEFGLTDKLQTSMYFNSKHKAFAGIDLAGNITGIEKESDFSFSNEWKWNLLNPSTKPIGLGLYGEFTFSSTEIELEGKIILDKKWDKNIFSFNNVEEFEFEKSFGVEDDGNGFIETHPELKIENDLAYMRMFKSNFGLGLEMRNHNIIDGGAWEFSTLNLGPTLYYVNKIENTKASWWVVLNVLPQLTNIGGEAPKGQRFLDEHEKLEARVLLGVSF